MSRGHVKRSSRQVFPYAKSLCAEEKSLSLRVPIRWRQFQSGIPGTMSRRKSDPTLPLHCSWLIDRHGKRRLRHQFKGRCRYFKNPIGSAEWLVEYREYERDELPVLDRHIPNTLGDLISRYYRSRDFLEQGEVSQAKVRAIIENFRD